jgi:hypothetical protein
MTGTRYTESGVVQTDSGGVLSTNPLDLTWTTPSDWDNSLFEREVHHDQPAGVDWASDDIAELGYANKDFGDSALIAYWPCHEDSGTTANELVNGNDGTITGSTLGTTGILGNTAFDNDGTDDRVSISSASAFDSPSSTDEVTMMAWIYIGSNSSPDSNYSHIFQKSNGSTGVDYGLVWQNNSQDATLASRIRIDGTQSKAVTTTNQDQAGKWIHHAMTAKVGGAIKTYLDGTEKASTSVGSGTIDDSNSGVGFGAHKDSDNSRWFDGKTCECMIFDRQLSATEINQLALQTSPTGTVLSGKKGDSLSNWTTIDTFEDGDLSGWTNEDGEWETVNHVDTNMIPQDGSRAAICNSDNRQLVSHPGDGLNYYPQQGDIIWSQIYSEQTCSVTLGFGIPSNGNVDTDGYSVHLDVNNNDINIQKDNNNLITASPTLDGDRGYTIKITWDDGSRGGSQGDILYDIWYTDTWDKITGISTNDTDYTDGGFGITYHKTNKSPFDFPRVT